MHRLSLAALLAFWTAPLAAHDTWILSRKAAVAAGEVARFDLTSGEKFPALESAVAPDRIARSGLRVRGKTLRFRGRDTEKNALLLTRAIETPGIAVAWVELKPKSIDLTPDEVAEYLAEIGYAESLGKDRAAKASSRWREIYRKHAKAFVRVGHGETDRPWRDPVGMALEIVPESDPTALTQGASLSVRVLAGGKPLAGFPLAAVSSGSPDRALAQTDAEGRVRIVLDRAGPWLLAGTKLSPSARPEADWESDFTTLTVWVAPAPPADPTPRAAPRPAELIPDQPFVGTPRPSEKRYEEILRLKESGSDDAALLEKIRKENVRYSLTTPEIQKLRAAGVSAAVIEAMLASGRTPTPR
jgi:uncharacterized GH25 family protein